MNQPELQQKLVAYMDAATDLAEQMRQDLRKGDQYSNETVLRLSEFMQQANKLQKVLDMLHETTLKYN